MASLTVSLVYY